MTTMMTATGLVKAYRGKRALDHFDLTVAPGEVCGLVGPNGAGKTTFIELVTGLVRPDEGTITIGGIDAVAQPRRARAVLGVSPQEVALYPNATAREHLRLFGGIHGLRGRRLALAIDEVAAAMALTDVLDQAAGVLSGGQRRRTQAATALIARPRLLLLDEPTAGADPVTRSALLTVVRQLAAAGTAVVYTTHYLPELDELDATIAFARAGRVVARGTRDEIDADSLYEEVAA
jgi:ABC-type multidrug transport system ATPase subunit